MGLSNQSKEIIFDLYDAIKQIFQMENDWKKRLGVVYSTNSEYQFESGQPKAQQTLPPDQQLLCVRLDRKNRKGRTVTLVDGFKGTEEDLKLLGKELKSRCGTGGSSKDGEILVQGDFRERVVTLLVDKGFKVKRSGG